MIGLLQAVVSHVAPGNEHVPQLALQQTMPELHVFGPHGTLSAERLMPLGSDCTLLGAALGAVSGAVGTADAAGAATALTGVAITLAVCGGLASDCIGAGAELAILIGASRTAAGGRLTITTLPGGGVTPGAGAAAEAALAA